MVACYDPVIPDLANISCMMGARSWRGGPGAYSQPISSYNMMPCCTQFNVELHKHRQRHILLHSVNKDLALDLPPSLSLPDGEEFPYGSATNLNIRTPEQKKEIYREYIRPPPNRTITVGEKMPLLELHCSRCRVPTVSKEHSKNASGPVLSQLTVVPCQTVGGYPLL